MLFYGTTEKFVGVLSCIIFFATLNHSPRKIANLKGITNARNNNSAIGLAAYRLGRKPAAPDSSDLLFYFLRNAALYHLQSVQYIPVSPLIMCSIQC